ncbi:hypothetical protein, partial [Burkholderia cenocepacia]
MAYNEKMGITPRGAARF